MNAASSLRRAERTVVAREIEKQMPYRFPMNMQPTAKNIRSMAKKISMRESQLNRKNLELATAA